MLSRGARGILLTQWTIVSWHLTGRTTSLEGHAADTAHIAFAVVIRIVVVARVPSPLRDAVPALDVYFHLTRREEKVGRGRWENVWRRRVVVVVTREALFTRVYS